jgi:formate hydrogenlyase transcriptional activator
LPSRTKMKRVSRIRGVASPSNAPGASLEELLAFERLLSDLSARFANVAVDQVVAEIESALKQLLRFLGFDRSAFWEFVDEEKRYFLCSVAVEGVEPPLRGPVPADLSWFATELRAGRTIVI